MRRLWGSVSVALAWAMTAAITIPSAALAASPAEDTDRYLQAELAVQGIPGLSLAVLRHGIPVYVRSYGVATLEHAVPVVPRTRFQIGSIGKQFTAVAIMMLADAHRIDLDVPVATYLPEVPQSWHDVTIRRMLSHQAGIPQLSTPEHDLLDLRRDYSDDELVKLAISLPLDFDPGTAASYSDTGYVLLGVIINRVTSGFYGDLLAARIFHPLGMIDTRILSDSDIIPNRASGYETGPDGAIRNQSYASPSLNRTADGSLYSTVVDLGQWDLALYGDRILPQDELQRMWSVDAHRHGERGLYHYGYGWEINRLRDDRVIEYDGNWQGFQGAMARYPDRGLTVIVLTNRALCRAQQMVHEVAGFWDPALVPYRSAVRDDAPTLTARFAALLAATASGQSDLSPFSAGAQPAFTARWLAGLRGELASIGRIQSVRFAESRRPHGRLERVYRVAAESMVDFFTVTYGANGRIEDLDLSREH